MLEARGITFGYRGRPPLFADFDLVVAPGERVALAAPSGFGKTTLCRLLSGYERPQAGRVLVDGEPLPRRGVLPVQLVGQHPERVLDPRMRMARSLEEAAPAGIDPALLEALGIREEWLRRFPHELSGGEMQRFCIARALAARPRYLVADEMTTMLDALTQARLWKAVLREVDASDMGLVFVSHSPALTGRIATRVVNLVDERRGNAC